MTRATLVSVLAVFLLAGAARAQFDDNHAPDCTAATPSVTTLWPPSHALVPITIEGVTDVDGDALDVVVTGVTQDEPLVGAGDGDACPDAASVGVDETVSLRAERSGKGDGRVYHVAFTADDGLGGTCSGEVVVCVPHDPGRDCGDGGASVDATGGAALCDGEACYADECEVGDPPADCAGDAIPASLTRRLSRSALLLERAALADRPDQEIRWRLHAAKIYRKAAAAAAKAPGHGGLTPACALALAQQLDGAGTCAACLLPPD